MPLDATVATSANEGLGNDPTAFHRTGIDDVKALRKGQAISAVCFK